MLADELAIAAGLEKVAESQATLGTACSKAPVGTVAVMGTAEVAPLGEAPFEGHPVYRQLSAFSASPSFESIGVQCDIITVGKGLDPVAHTSEFLGNDVEQVNKFRGDELQNTGADVAQLSVEQLIERGQPPAFGQPRIDTVAASETATGEFQAYSKPIAGAFSLPGVSEYHQILSGVHWLNSDVIPQKPLDNEAFEALAWLGVARSEVLFEKLSADRRTIRNPSRFVLAAARREGYG